MEGPLGVDLDDGMVRITMLDPDGPRRFALQCSSPQPLASPHAPLEERAADTERAAFALLQTVATDRELGPAARTRGLVVGIPAGLTKREQRAVRRGAEAAGLAVYQLLDQSVLAALAPETPAKQARRVALLDLTGRSASLTVMDCTGAELQLLGTGPLPSATARHLNERIATALAAAFQALHGVDLHEDPLGWARVMRLAGAARRDLSKEKEISLHLPWVAQLGGGPVDLKVTLTQAMVSELLSEDVESTIKDCENILELSGIDRASLDHVLVREGDAESTGLRRAVTAWFEQPNSLLLLGSHALADAAAGLARTRPPKPLRGDLATIVGALKLQGGDGRWIELLPNGLPLPQTRRVVLTTSCAGQESLSFGLAQEAADREGPRRMLGAIGVSGLPTGRSGAVKLHLEVEADAEGLVRLSARVDGQQGSLLLTLLRQGEGESPVQALRLETSAAPLTLPTEASLSIASPSEAITETPSDQPGVAPLPTAEDSQATSGTEEAALAQPAEDVPRGFMAWVRRLFGGA